MIHLFGDLLTSGSAAHVVAGLLLLAGGGVFAVCAVSLGFIDLREHRLPNRILYPWAGITAVILVLVSFLLGEGSSLVRALLGGLAWGAAFLLIRLVHPPSLGMGDVKLVVVLGMYAAYLGWETLAAAVVVSFLLGGLVCLGLVLARRASRATRVPFGPFLLAGTALALIFSPASQVDAGEVRCLGLGPPCTQGPPSPLP
ncbi:A24 family peptidase [Nesterenkonia flava]|uniref:A24 family peptidase n=1 Tax=Nesterenkonia flava TaxID=469799 RepID=A0ABU1FQ68_9MICC|nr:A24 family peptidase [Nesterenkonia flava]MDR5710803.1 A24 family peptidase [Nesterenkonia flava]